MRGKIAQPLTSNTINSDQLGLKGKKLNPRLYKPKLAPKMCSIVDLLDRKIQAKLSQDTTEEGRTLEAVDSKTSFQPVSEKGSTETSFDKVTKIQ